jgi:hypothetical protein
VLDGIKAGSLYVIATFMSKIMLSLSYVDEYFNMLGQQYLSIGL